MTIRETIQEKSKALREIEKIGPYQASIELVALGSLLSSLNAEIVEKQFILNQKKVELLTEAKSVAKAKLLSEATPEWREYTERVYQREAMENLMRAVKYYLKASSTELGEFTR